MMQAQLKCRGCIFLEIYVPECQPRENGSSEHPSTEFNHKCISAQNPCVAFFLAH